MIKLNPVRTVDKGRPVKRPEDAVIGLDQDRAGGRAPASSSPDAQIGKLAIASGRIDISKQQPDTQARAVTIRAEFGLARSASRLTEGTGPA